MQVSVKTLRHYEQKGLLLPDEVDEWTGYRYYRMTQMQELNAIRRFKEMGFSLDEIKDMCDADALMPTIDQLDGKIAECDEQLRLLAQRRLHLLKLKNSQKQINEMENISIQSLPSIVVASHRSVIKSYETLGDLCVNVIGPEMHRLGCKCSSTNYCFTIEHGKEYRPTDIDIEYCEEVEEMGEDSAIIQFKRLEAIPMAICMKHFGPYDRFYRSYTELFQYIEENHYKVVGSPRSCYIDGIWNQSDPEKWLSILQIPVERA